MAALASIALMSAGTAIIDTAIAAINGARRRPRLLPVVLTIAIPVMSAGVAIHLAGYRMECAR